MLPQILGNPDYVIREILVQNPATRDTKPGIHTDQFHR